MKIEKVQEPIYRVEFNEDVLQMLKSVLGNIGLKEMEFIGADDYHYPMVHKFYKLLDSIE